jgi:GNAT superfamily N-acetyltransferase
MIRASKNSAKIRSIRRGEASLVLRFIRELAEYERLLDRVTADEAALEALLFGPTPRAFCEIAEIEGEPVGFALWYYNVSSFTGRAGIYLEDLYVRPEARGKGAGKALLAELAQECVKQGLARLEWAVLDWNTPSILFYDSLGADAEDAWIVRSITGEALVTLARNADGIA